MQITHMLEAIKVYQARLGYDYNYESEEARITHIRELALALFQETAEFVDWTPWKPWRDINSQTNDQKEAAFELIDLFFFTANLWSAIGMETKDFKKFFMQKLEENCNRIDRGYNKTRQHGENQQGELL